MPSMKPGDCSISVKRALPRAQEFFDAGKLKPHIFATFGLKNVSKAFALSKTGTVIGKVSVVS